MKVVDGTPTYYSYNEANQLLAETTGDETTYYHYDGCGNTVARQEAAGTTYYHYDTENLITRIDFPDGGHGYYSYDADSKRVDQRTADGFREFVYQGPDMLKLQLERDESEETVAHYTMGSGLEAMRRSDASSFYHFNHLGTTLALTGADEAVSDTYRHDAWGVLLERTGSTANPHTYVGRERYYRMPNAEMYHLGFRDYAQGLGRFVVTDPVRNKENWLVYCLNRSSLMVDPLGLQTLPEIGNLLRQLPSWLGRLLCRLIAAMGLVAGYHAFMEWLAHQCWEEHEEGREELHDECQEAWDLAKGGTAEAIAACQQKCMELFSDDYNDMMTCYNGCSETPPGPPTHEPGEFGPAPVEMPWEAPDDESERARAVSDVCSTLWV